MTMAEPVEIKDGMMLDSHVEGGVRFFRVFLKVGRSTLVDDLSLEDLELITQHAQEVGH